MDSEPIAFRNSKARFGFLRFKITSNLYVPPQEIFALIVEHLKYPND